MGRLTQCDLRRTLGFLGELSAPQDLAEFLRRATEGLSRLVTSDITTLSHCNLVASTRRVVTWPEGAITQEHQSLFDRFIHQHPLVQFHSRHPQGGTRKITDFHSLGRLRRTDLYAEYYDPLGIDYVIAMPLIADRSRIISFVLNRDMRDFSEHDRQLLELVRPSLADLYNNCVALEEARAWVARLHNVALADSGALIVLDGHEHVRDFSDQAPQQVHRFLPHCRLAPGAALPTRIARWLELEMAGAGATKKAASPLLLQNDGGSLSISLVTDRERDEHYLVLREKSPASWPDDLQALPLTRREREVMQWVAAGKTNPEVGKIIGASARTVQKHLEHIFVKLGVETRTAAVARALGIGAAFRNDL